jgi:hypothetical protein
MVAKGHHFPGVELAAVVDADTGLSLPDFRAEERTFQLITQLAGRSGRDAPGRVLVQTFQPDARPIVHAARHDVDRFLSEELERRQALDYPPYAHLVRIVVSGPELEPVVRALEELKAGITAAELLAPRRSSASGEIPPSSSRRPASRTNRLAGRAPPLRAARRCARRGWPQSSTSTRRVSGWARWSVKNRRPRRSSAMDRDVTPPSARARALRRAEFNPLTSASPAASHPPFRRAAHTYLPSLGGPLPYMQRARQIDDETERHRPRSPRPTRSTETIEGWRRLAARWDFGEVSELIERHNRWYPVEAQLPMDPRTRDYVKVGGRSYRRNLLDSEWILEQFP